MEKLKKAYKALSLREKFVAVSISYILITIIFILLIIMLSSCGVIKGHSNWFVDKGIKASDSLYVPDNAIEEKIEDGIEAVTGVEVDLSPNIGPEK